MARSKNPCGGPVRTITCQVCYGRSCMARTVCCKYSLCLACTVQYYTTQISLGRINITCVNCDTPIPRSEVIIRLDFRSKRKLARLVAKARDDQLDRCCPRCAKIPQVPAAELNTLQAHSYGYQVGVINFINDIIFKLSCICICIL